MITRLLTYIFLIISVQNIFAQQRVVSGLVIDEKTTWSGTVIVEGDVTVAKKGRLIIEAGARILFRPHVDKTKAGKDKTRSELVVYGILIVKGRLENKVIFSSAGAEPRLGDWFGLRLMNPKKISVLDYCVVEYAFNGISIKKSNPVIRNSQITLNYNAGILVEVKAEPMISKNIISENGYAGVITSLGAKPILADNLIAANQIGVIAFSLSQPNLGNLSNSKKVNQGRNNIFENSEYDVYNHTNLPLMAENNSWGEYSSLSQIGSRIYDAVDESKYGPIDFLPVFKKANLDEFLQISQTGAPDTGNLVSNNVDAANKINGQIAQSVPPENLNVSEKAPESVDRVKEAVVKTNTPLVEDKVKKETVQAEKLGKALSKSKPAQPAQVEPVKQEIDVDQIFFEFFLDSKKAIVVKKVAPVIRNQQLGLGAKGKIIARVVVGKDGTVESASVIKGLNPYFDSIAKEAAQQFKYKIGKVKGTPVRFYTNILFKF